MACPFVVVAPRPTPPWSAARRASACKYSRLDTGTRVAWLRGVQCINVHRVSWRQDHHRASNASAPVEAQDDDDRTQDTAQQADDPGEDHQLYELAQAGRAEDQATHARHASYCQGGATALCYCQGRAAVLSVHAMATRSQRHNPPPRPPPLVLPQSSAAPKSTLLAIAPVSTL